MNTSDCIGRPIENRHAMSLLGNNVLLLHRQERVQPKLFLIPKIPRKPFVCVLLVCFKLMSKFLYMLQTKNHE